jgi:hypothetical protein
MSAENKDEKLVITRKDLTKIFEDIGLNAENIEKADVIFDHAVLVKVADIKEDLVAKFEVQEEQLVKAVDAYMEESVGDIRNMMLLAVSSLGGPSARDEFIRKVAAAAQSGALSAASGDWAQGSPDDSERNRRSVAGSGVSKAVHSEETEAEIEEALTEHYVDAISRTVRK